MSGELIERAADFLDEYAAFIHTVKADDLVCHPYLPEVVEVAKGLRAELSSLRGEAHREGDPTWLVEALTSSNRQAAECANNQADVIGRLVGALEKIKAHANKLRNGTDDWFELVEFEGMASQALASLPSAVKKP